MVSKIFYFHPNLGKIPILINILQLGWFNHHQSEVVSRIMTRQHVGGHATCRSRDKFFRNLICRFDSRHLSQQRDTDHMRNQCDHIITAIYIFFVQIKQQHNNINQKQQVCFLGFLSLSSRLGSRLAVGGVSVFPSVATGTSQMTPWDSDWAGGTEGLKREVFVEGSFGMGIVLGVWDGYTYIFFF